MSDIDPFIVLLMAVDSQEHVSDLPSKNWSHQAIGVVGNQEVENQLLLQLLKEDLKVQAKLI
jgi:hypothetical protein